MYGRFGWNTGFENIMPRGHEILTERALGMSSPGGPGAVTINVRGRPIVTELNAQETRAIVEGNRAVDVADLAATQRMLQSRPLRIAAAVSPLVAAGAAQVMGTQLIGHVVHSVREAEQKLHSLRRNPGQDWRVALREITAELDSQYRRIVAAGNPFPLIGAALHLVQDSYCPAHTQRRDRTGCLMYVRNYGGNDNWIFQRGGRDREHMFPTDARDSVAANPSEANAAVAASREFLQIVFKALWGRKRPTPDMAIVNEAYEDFRQFVQRHFAAC